MHVPSALLYVQSSCFVLNSQFFQQNIPTMSSNLIKTFDKTPTTVGLATTSILISCFLTIFNIYYQWRFLRLRQHPFICKRHPYLVSLYASLNTLSILIDRTLSVLIHSGIYTAIWFQWFRWILWVTLLRSAIIAMLLRVYLLFYNVQWTKANDLNRWKCYINKNEDKKLAQSFFIDYHSTYGNIRYVYKYFIAIWLFLTTITVSAFAISFYVSSLCDAIIYILICLIMAILWLKTPMFHDQFLIQS